GYLGCGNGLCRLVNIGEYSVTCALHSRQYPNPVFESWAAKPGKAGPVRFIKGSLEDEGAGDFVNRLRHVVHVLFAFDDARSGDERDRSAAAEDDALSTRCSHFNRIWGIHGAIIVRIKNRSVHR